MSKSRYIVKGDQRLEVLEHIILRNMWEVYVLEKHENGLAFALVMGFCQEMGTVDLKEYDGHIVSRTDDLCDVLPPDGWEWEDADEMYNDD